jgi:hypothetical protein
MKRFTFHVQIVVMAILLVSASCTSVSPAEIPASEPPSVSGAANIPVENTATSIPPTEAPTFTSTPVPVTETPSVTPTSVLPTETPTFFIGIPSQTARSFNNRITIYLPNLAGEFRVSANTAVTISDAGTDRKVNNCTISKSGVVKVERYIPLNGPSNSFSLERGTYILRCDQRSPKATIYSE